VGRVLIAFFLRLFWGINKDEGRGRWVAWLKHDHSPAATANCSTPG
jgi:hypothetical protein